MYLFYYYVILQYIHKNNSDYLYYFCYFVNHASCYMQGGAFSESDLESAKSNMNTYVVDAEFGICLIYLVEHKIKRNSLFVIND